MAVGRSGVVRRRAILVGTMNQGRDEVDDRNSRETSVVGLRWFNKGHIGAEAFPSISAPNDRMKLR